MERAPRARARGPLALLPHDLAAQEQAETVLQDRDHVGREAAVRTAAEVRSIFTKAGGQLAGSGAVAWQFEPRGLITIPAKGQDPDDLALVAIDAGADDVDTTGAEVVEVFTTPGGLEQVRKALDAAGVPVESAESTMVAKNTVEVDEHRARQNLRLVESLEDHDDVQRVTANFDIPEELFAEVAG